MLQNLLERGLRIDESILCVVDGGKGIRKALVASRGDANKLRNLRSYLQVVTNARDTANARVQGALVSRNGYDEAAGSLREGMEETLTVVKLALPDTSQISAT